MPIPLAFLAGAAGLFGARRLVQGIQNQGFRQALPFATENLTDNQAQTVMALARGDSRAAFDFAVLMAERNRAQKNLAESRQMDTARLDLQRAGLELRGQEFDQNVRAWEFQRATTDRELALQSAALMNPALAAQLAARNGKDSFAVIDQQTGAVRQIPMAGSDTWNESVGTANVMAQLINDIQETVRLAQDPEVALTDENSAAAGRYQALRASILAGVKDAEQLGALDEGVIQFASLLAPDATTFGNAWFQGRDRNLAQLQTTLGRYQGRLRDQISLMNGFQGIGLPAQRKWAQALGFEATSNAKAIAADRAREGSENVGASIVDTGVIQGGKLAREAINFVTDTIGRIF